MNFNSIKNVLVTVGDLPERYDGNEHDWSLELAIKNVLQDEFPGASIQVEYVYSGKHSLTAWYQNGDMALRRLVDLTHIFNRIQQ